MKQPETYADRLKDPVFWMGFWAWRKGVEKKERIKREWYNMMMDWMNDKQIENAQGYLNAYRSLEREIRQTSRIIRF